MSERIPADHDARREAGARSAVCLLAGAAKVSRRGGIRFVPFERADCAAAARRVNACSLGGALRPKSVV
jgi:hypothetical protein